MRMLRTVTSLLSGCWFALPAGAGPAGHTPPDLSNPEIWQEKPAPLGEKEKEEQCRLFQHSACPYAQDAQSDGEREAGRRDRNRYYKAQEEGDWRHVKPR